MLVNAGCEESSKFIQSQIGIPQGAPISSLDFCLAVHPFNKELENLSSSDMQQGFVRAYADDTKVIAPTAQIINVLQHQCREGPTKGLILQPNKHKILLGRKGPEAQNIRNSLADQFHIPLDNIVSHPLDCEQSAHLFGDIVMGIPIGSEQFLEKEIERIKAKISNDFELVAQFENTQIQNVFIRYVLKNKLTHLLRGLEPANSQVICRHFNNCLRKLLAVMCGVDQLDDISWHLARVPIEYGGAGYGFCEALIAPAHVAAIIAAIPELVQILPDFVDQVEQGLNGHDSEIPMIQNVVASLRFLEGRGFPTWLEMTSATGGHAKKLQKMLSHDVAPFDVAHDLILEGDSEGAQLVNSGSSKEAGAWLLAIPKTADMSLSSIEFATTLRNRLLVQHPLIQTELKCIYGKPVDKRGIHLKKCKKQNNLTISTHDSLKSVLHQMCKAAQVPCQVEVANLFRQSDPNDASRMDLMLQLPEGETVAVDVRIAHPINHLGSFQQKGQPAHLAEQLKIFKYGRQCEAQGFRLCAAVFETQGLGGNSFSRLFNALINIMKGSIPTSVLRSYWVNKFSVALQKGVTREINTRCALVRAQRDAQREDNPLEEAVRGQQISRGLVGIRSWRLDR